MIYSMGKHRVFQLQRLASFYATAIRTRHITKNNGAEHHLTMLFYHKLLSYSRIVLTPPADKIDRLTLIHLRLPMHVKIAKIEGGKLCT